jgi:membrane fusion protein, heavy metal efflux system
MQLKILASTLLILCVSCNQGRKNEEIETHEDAKLQYTSYNDDYELFAEADPFITGETANVLSHFSELPGFKPLERGPVKLILTVNGTETVQTLDSAIRKGIYSFDLKPEKPGKGTLKYEIKNSKGISVILISDITVFDNHEAAHSAAEEAELSQTNTTSFTKEQSWKIDFSTGFPEKIPFGQVIKATAIVQPSPANEIIVVAKTNGIISTGGIFAGKEVSSGQVLFTISGKSMAENNSSVRYAEAKNNHDKAKADYERAKDLAADKIVSEKELLNARIQYENAKAIFDNLNENFSASGQNVTSPMRGYVRQVFVENGSYVEAGKPVLSVSQNKTLVLTAEVPQRYAQYLGSISSANIRSSAEGVVYTLDQLHGKMLSYGKAATSSSFLIPVTLEIENPDKFTPGNFVEVWLKTTSENKVITVPNTSLIEEQGIFSVYVQVHPELFEKREVKVGLTDGLRSEILAGITDNERIITKGAIFVKLARSTGTLDAHAGHVH